MRPRSDGRGCRVLVCKVAKNMESTLTRGGREGATGGSPAGQ